MRDMRETIAGQDVEQEAANLAAIAAWDDYRRTGLHATFEEVDAWLAQLERGLPAEPPRCRN